MEMGHTVPMASKRVNFLDSLRGFAAAWVVLFHINEGVTFAPSSYQTFVSYGYLGVPIFFLLSGYSIHASLLRGPSVRDYLWSRFWRIYPPYLVSLAVVIAVVLVRKLTNGSNDLVPIPNSPIEFFQVLTLTTEPLGSTSPMNVVYWTLTYEVAFYLWLGLGLVLPRLRWAIIFAPVILSLVWHDAPIFFIDLWGIFALGVAIAEWHHRRSAVVPALIVFCSVNLLLYGSLGYAIATGVAFVLVSMALTPRFDVLNRLPLMPRVGDWSYSLYLTHVPILTLVWFVLSGNSSVPSNVNLAMRIATDAVYFMCACFFAVIFWMAVERPAIYIARRRLQFWRSKPQSPEIGSSPF